MKYQIKRTSLTGKEEILPTVYEDRNHAKGICTIFNSARIELHSLVEIEEEAPKSVIVIKVQKRGKANLVSDIRAYPGAAYWKLTNNMEFAKKSHTMAEAEAVAQHYLDYGYSVDFIEVKRATFADI